MIDWSRIEELREEVGEEDFEEIAVLFLSEIQDAVQDLPGITDRQARSEAFHGMKGSAMNLGFGDFAALCAKGEADPDLVDTLHLAETLNQSLAAVRAKFPQLA